MSKGMFVLIEGGEGAGKTTLAKRIVRSLGEKGVRAKYTREPGDGIPEARELLMSLNRNMENKDHLAELELALFLADRVRHYPMIERSVAEGCIVVSDRGPASTIAYQCFGRGLDEVRVMRQNTIATNGMQPDLVVHLDGDVQTLLARVPKDDNNRFKEEDVEFHERVRQGFRSQQAINWVVVNAEADRDTVFAEVLEHILKKHQELAAA